MVAEYVVEWAGGRIGGGATVWHFENPLAENESESVADLVREFYGDLVTIFPSDITFNFPTEMRILDPATGNLTAIEPLAGQDPLTGTSANNYANGVGAMVRLSTSAIAGNRRLLGRIFLVPIHTPAFTTNGDVAVATRDIIDAAYNTFRTAVQVYQPHVVWSRVHGVVSPVVSGSTQARPSTLRTRNDR